MLHSIFFDRKYWTIPKALEWLDRHNYVHRKIDITPHTYRFRQRPPRKNASYYSKALPNHVTLVLYKGGRVSRRTEDGGSLSSIVSRVADLFVKKRNDYPPKVRQWLKEHGDERIFYMYVSRQPIWSVIGNFLNILSFGSFKDNIRKAKYDDMFHLYLIFTTESGNWFIEKNEVIKIDRYKLNPNNLDKMSVPYEINSLTMNKLLNNAQSKVGNDFFQYNAINNNCQVFVRNLLQYSNLLTPELYSYIMQDANSVLKSGTFARELAIVIPDLASRFNRLIYGNGKF